MMSVPTDGSGKMMGWVGCGILLSLFLGWYALIPFTNRDGSVRAKASQTQSELRDLAVALEAYHADHHCYPAPALSSDMGFPILGAQLTTPVAYRTGLPVDPFKKRFDGKMQRPDALVYGYWIAPQGGWVLVGVGPDKRPSIDLEMLKKIYAAAGDAPMPTALLLTYTYDPTNGLTSSGDIFRVKQ
jgi:hypothetical protein